MRVDDMTLMTEGVLAAYGAGWGGFHIDKGTTAYIAIGMIDDEPCVVVLGCLDGQWGAEATDEDGQFLAGGYGDTPQDALDDLF